MKKHSIQEVIECAWHKWAPYWHVGTVIIGMCLYVLFWFHDVDGARAQVVVNTIDISNMKQSLALMQQRQEEMKEELHAVWQTVVKH